MVRAILPDNDIRGQVSRLVLLLQRRDWLDLWQSLHIAVADFADFGLEGNAKDDQMWRVCQENSLVLVTGNRRHSGPDSLESTIRRFNTGESLPILTLADTRKPMTNAEYAERAVIKMLDYLMNIEHFRGTGRLYIP